MTEQEASKAPQPTEPAKQPPPTDGAKLPQPTKPVETKQDAPKLLQPKEVAQWRKHTTGGGALHLHTLLADNGGIAPDKSADDLRLAYTELLSGRDRAWFFANLTNASLKVMFLVCVILVICTLYLLDPHNKLTASPAPTVACVVLGGLCAAIFFRIRKWRLYIGDLRLCNRILPLLRKQLAGRMTASHAESLEKVPERRGARQVLADYESASTNSGRILILRFFILPLSALLTAYVCYRIIDELWPRQPSVILTSKDTLQEVRVANSKTVTLPYVYKIEWNQYVAEGSSGFLGIGSQPSTWYFQVSLANLTPATTGLISLRGHWKLASERAGIFSSSMELFQDPKKPYKAQTVLWADDKTGVLSIGIPTVEADKTNSVFLFVESDIKPTVDDLDLTISCDEGAFRRITPAQWGKIEKEKAAP